MHPRFALDDNSARNLPARPSAWRAWLALFALLAGIHATVAPAHAADRSVPGTRCLLESLSPFPPRISFACSEVDLSTWLASRSLSISQLEPTPAAQPDGSLEQGAFRAPGGDWIILARFIGSQFFAPQPRSRDAVRAAYASSFGIAGVDVNWQDLFIREEGACIGEFAVAGTAPTRLSGSIYLYRHCAPNPVGPYWGRRILYIEGHSSFYDLGGIEHIRWMAERGFEVFVAEMPLWGFNSPDGSTSAYSHDDYIYLERDAVSPLWSEIVAPFGAIYSFVREGASGPVGMTGRSGGGMSAYSAGIAHPLADYVISIAGGTPLSMRLASPVPQYEISDWEQWSPRTYREVGHEELMRHAGRLGGFYFYAGLDPCCFRVMRGDGFQEWLGQPTDDGRIVEIRVDPDHDQHALSESGRTAMLSFLDRIFAAPSLTVSVVGRVGGRVTSAPAGIDCGSLCTALFVPGQVIDLAARVEPGFEFVGWGGACAGTGACRVTMNDARQVTAVFTATRFALTVTRAGSGAGTVTSIPAGIDCGATCTADFLIAATVVLTAVGDSNSSFSGWGGACTGTGPCTVTMDAAREVTATFTRPLYTLTVSRIGDGAGTVTSNPAGLACGASCSAPFTAGTPIVLNVAPSAGSAFLGWGGACAGTGPCAVTLSAATSVTAAFGRNSSIPRLRNISTRMQVQLGDNALIGGFIIGGTQAKTVLVRARGPSLEPLGVVNTLSDPQLQLYSGQTVIASNDDWRQAADADAIQALGFAPSDARESAILATLLPGAYTAIVNGAGATTGIGIVEVFEVDSPANALVNISTRGRSSSGENVMIGGFVIQGDAPMTVIVRARGPSLAAFGVTGTLVNPTLLLFAGKNFIASNEDWVDSPDAARIQALGFAPANPYEAAILITLPPGAYTAMVSDALGRPGIGIVEVFAQ